jgi:hypothetical protein
MPGLQAGVGTAAIITAVGAPGTTKQTADNIHFGYWGTAPWFPKVAFPGPEFTIEPLVEEGVEEAAGAVALDGTTHVVVGASGDLSVARALTGNTHVAIGVSGDLVVARSLIGNTHVAVGASGDLVVARGLVGSTHAIVELDGDLTVSAGGAVSLDGIIAIAIGLSGDLAVAVALSGATGVVVELTGDLAAVPASVDKPWKLLGGGPVVRSTKYAHPRPGWY